MATDCVLFLPDLLNIDQHAAAEFEQESIPTLLTLLSRANCSRGSVALSPLQNVMQLLGYRCDADTELPIAVFRQASTPISTPGTLWCADPVSLQVDRDSAVVLPPDLLHITAAETQQLIETLNRHFSDDGLRFSALSPQAWLLHSDTPWRLQTCELPEAIGRSVRNFAPRGEDAQRWRRIGNEIEMLLFNHPVNQERETQQRWPITGVWLWGGGAKPSRATPRVDVIYTDDDTVATLAQSVSLPVRAVPSSLHRFDWSAYQHIGLVMLKSIDANQLLQLDAHWFVPLQNAVRAGKLHQLIIKTRQQQFTITRRSIRRWWRRQHHLAYWCT